MRVFRGINFRQACRLPTLLVFALGFIACASHSGRADAPTIASTIDCKAPSAVFDRTVCDSPALSQANKTLTTTYTNVLPKLSDAGKTDLIRSQTDWLSLFRKLITAPPPSTSPKSLVRRIMRIYTQRQSALDKAVFLAQDGTLIRRAESFVLHANANEPGGYVLEDIAYPQIDAPKDESQRHWNATVQHDIPASSEHDCDGKYGDLTSDYTIGWASARFISIKFIESRYCPGTPHGYVHRFADNRFLKSNHLLAANDIFDPTSGWDNALTTLAVEGVRSQGRNRGANPTAPHAFATNPKFWTLTDDGLTIDIDELSGAPAGLSEVLIPWNKLTPYLAKQRSLPIPD